MSPSGDKKSHSSELVTTPFPSHAMLGFQLPPGLSLQPPAGKNSWEVAGGLMQHLEFFTSSCKMSRGKRGR